MVKCRGCGAEMEWGVTEANGRPIPLDPGTFENGNLLVVGTKSGAPVVRVVAAGSEPGLRMAHKATCPSPPQRGSR